MKVFKDIFSGSNMFSDKFEYNVVDEIFYEVRGRHVTKKLESGDDEDEIVHSGVDVILENNLQEVSVLSKKSVFKANSEEFMKKIVEKLEATAPEEVEIFKTKFSEEMNKNLFKLRSNELQFFVGENSDSEGTYAVLEYRDDVPYIKFSKHALVEEEL